MTTPLKHGIDFIGVGTVFFCHDGQGKFLLGKRGTNSRDEQGNWGPGGGGIEFGETPEETVKREVFEEYGTHPTKLEFIGPVTVLRQINDQPTHWLQCLYLAEVDRSTVTNNEPHKTDELGWFDLNQFPQPAHTQMDRFVKIVQDYLKNHHG